jgi:acyl transferase domain-containing protein
MRVSINAMGYGGANAHAIIEAAEPYLREKGVTHKTYNIPIDGVHTVPSYNRKFLLKFSASDEWSLNRNVEEINAVLKKFDILDVAYTLSTRRSDLLVRGFGLVDGASADPKCELVKTSKGGSAPRLAFVFTGNSRYYILKK